MTMLADAPRKNVCSVSGMSIDSVVITIPLFVCMFVEQRGKPAAL
ncbi:hypothetical protein [Mycolicibacterium austroafricanum]|nr:hypothetical protein [Mycolicibacterium austroafricanum]